MAKVKTGKWAPEETARVQGIPKDSRLRQTLEKISKDLGRPFANVYQKWYSEYQKGTSSPTSKLNPKDIPVMKLGFDPDYTGKNTNIDETEKLSFEKGLELNVPKLEPFKGALLVPRRFEKLAKEYLTKYYPKMVFTLVSIVGNSKEKRLMRKI